MDFSFMKFSTTSKSTAYPAKVKSPPAHDAPDIKPGIVKAARACFPPDEPEALQNGGAQCLPPGRSCP
eukprot:5181792-Alexandrium_andersonii.AAC.1